MRRIIVANSSLFTSPEGMCCMKFSSVSAARLASSCVGEPGDDATAPGRIGVLVDLPPRLLLLRLWCRVGETVVSIPNGGPVISLAGDSSAEEGAVAELLYLGVGGSVACCWANSMSSVGNVWLLGRWKFGASNIPLFGSGENVNCEMGLNAPPEKLEADGSVTAEFNDVVLCDLNWFASKSAKAPAESFPSLLGVADTIGDEVCPGGEAGEMPPGVCVADNIGESADSCALSGMAVSEALRTSLPGPMPFFCLNFSNHDLVMILDGFSELPVPAKKARAWFSSSSSLTTTPFFC